MEIDQRHMLDACRLALRGQGAVEPNPMVGCVIAAGERVLATGWHERFGGPHAEVVALQQAAAAGLADDLAMATLYVTLEPCCHQGKTPPCTAAILASPLRRVVVAVADPFPLVAGAGVRQLRDGGVTVEVGVAEAAANSILAPYRKLVQQERPWISAKWAMTLDGKIASWKGDSRWISSAASRELVHALRGRMDGIMVGIGTALADDPLLTARPPGARTATRIVVDSQARLPPHSQLVKTAELAPVLVAVGPAAQQEPVKRLADAGVEVYRCEATSHAERLGEILAELGRRRATNVLVEGGTGLLGALHDLGEIDEVHAFIAPRLAGGRQAYTPIGGHGLPYISDALQLHDVKVRQIEGDVYVRGRVAK